MTEKSNSVDKENEISLKDLLIRLNYAILFLIQKWRWILLFAVIGLLAGLSYAFFKNTVYIASVSFVTDTEQGGSSGLGSYAGLAAQFGLDLGNSGLDNDLFSGDNVYDLMKTRRMLESTLLTPIIIKGKKTLLIDRYIQIEGLKNKWMDKPYYRNIVFDGRRSGLTVYHNAVISRICKMIVANNLRFPDEPNGSNSSSIMSVNCRSKDEQFSALFLEKLVENVAQFYIDTKTKRARKTLSVLSKQLDSVRTQLYGAMSSVAAFQDRNQNLVRVGPRVQQQKSSLKLNVNSAIYQQLVGAVETAKMNLQKETPLFEIIDKPILPLNKYRPSKIILGAIGFLIGAFLSACWLLIRRFYNRMMFEG